MDKPWYQQTTVLIGGAIIAVGLLAVVGPKIDIELGIKNFASIITMLVGLGMIRQRRATGRNGG